MRDLDEIMNLCPVIPVIVIDRAEDAVPMLKSIFGPLPQLLFCPTGGVNPHNAQQYLSLPNVPCVGGTWMLDKATIAAGDWAEIERVSRLASALSS